MRRALVILLGLAILGAPGAGVAQGGGDDPRSGFIISRRKAADTAKRRPRAGRSSGRAVARLEPLGIGYSVYRQLPNGAPVRVDPSKRLRDGDRIRLVVEANTDGYLYVFNSDDRGTPPVMIYPDPRLKGGENRIQAHVPYEIPSSREPDESLRWLHLADGPVSDRLHVVVSREPLEGVPTGGALAEASRSSRTGLWEPGRDVFTRLEREGVSSVASDVALVGLRQSRDETEAVQRSVRLRPTAPAPSVVHLGSESAPVLMATVVLSH